MFTLMIYEKSETEQHRLSRIIRYIAARLTDEKMILICNRTREQVGETLETVPLLDYAVMCVSNETDLELLRKTRVKFPQIEIMLIADPSISPTKYVAVNIRAISLIIRPYHERECVECIKDFIKDCIEKRKCFDEQKSFSIKNKSGRIVIPFQKIYWIEVRSGKVHVVLENKEYCAYGTLKRVSSQLPDHFMQCHRSFVFNTDYVAFIKLSSGLIYMDNGKAIPVSRTYRENVKEFLRAL